MLGSTIHFRVGGGYRPKSKYVGAGVYEVWFEAIKE